MTERWLIIAAVAGATYLTRISGLLVAGRQVPPLLDRFLAYVPVAVFATLITPDAGIGTASTWPRLLALAAAALAAYRFRQLWAGLLTGMVVFELLRLL